MYLGYQINERMNEEFIAHVAKSKEELLKIYNEYTKIETTDKEVELIDGAYYLGEEINRKKSELSAKHIREVRNAKISETDYLMTPDYPISAENIEELKVYRQALRDVPELTGFPDDVIWPTVPKFLCKEEEEVASETTGLAKVGL